MTASPVIYNLRKNGSFEPTAWYNLIRYMRNEHLLVSLEDYWPLINQELEKFQGHYAPGSGEIKFPDQESLVSFVLAWS